MTAYALVITCEHAVNTIPESFNYLFHHNEIILNSHRAIDFGAKSIAEQLSHHFNCPLFTATVSRLIIDFNRSLHHQNVLSRFTKTLDKENRAHLINQYYFPYRNSIQQTITKLLNEGRPVLHLSIHSFTPRLKGQLRQVDIGLLYDPKRVSEKTCARVWQSELNRLTAGAWRIRLNAPYRGVNDALITSLRKQFNHTHYLGFELEINQSLMTPENKVAMIIINSIEPLLKNNDHATYSFKRANDP